MEVISIERSTYEELLANFNCFVVQMRALVQLPFTSHMSSIIVFLQLNCDWVPLIVTLPITGTTPFFSYSCSHRTECWKYFSFFLIFLNFGCKTTIFIHSYKRNKKLVAKRRWKVPFSAPFRRVTFLVSKFIDWVTN